MSKNIPVPTEIEYHQNTRMFDIAFENGEKFSLSAEYLRVYSPSAEVRGHSPDQEVLQVGKADVKITHIEPVGQYAVLLRFDDGHDTGIYSWDWLYFLGKDQATLWAQYLAKLEKAGAKRAPGA
jgi:DUF971 family protein